MCWSVGIEREGGAIEMPEQRIDRGAGDVATVIGGVDDLSGGLLYDKNFGVLVEDVEGDVFGEYGEFLELGDDEGEVLVFLESMTGLDSMFLTLYGAVRGEEATAVVGEFAGEEGVGAESGVCLGNGEGKMCHRKED